MQMSPDGVDHGVMQKFTQNFKQHGSLNFLTQVRFWDNHWRPREQAVDWASVPRLVHPMGGCLPEKRLLKKCQQLESMAAEVVKIATGKLFHLWLRELINKSCTSLLFLLHALDLKPGNRKWALDPYYC